MRFVPRDVDTSVLLEWYQSGLSLEQISRRVPLTAGGVRLRLRRAGHVLRSKNHGMRQPPPNKKPVPTEVLIARYAKGEPAHVIGRAVGLSAKAVLDRLRRAGVERRKRGDYEGQRGSANPNWRGGRWVRDDGYAFISAPPGYTRAVFEHRYVMECILKRRLKRCDLVHHINGIRDDNRPENLVVVDARSHEARTYIKALQRRICYLESRLRENGLAHN